MDSEENKIETSETPRSDGAEYFQYDTEPPLPLGLVDVEFARKLEIELNTAIANEAFAENKAYKLEKELKQAQDRIKRLEAAGDEMEKYIFDQTNTRFIICAIKWREAKEDKP
jgi:hypothetical protein